METVERCRALVGAELCEKLVGVRHHIHMYPECAFEVENTARLIEEYLTKLGGAFSLRRMCGTAVIADLVGSGAAREAGAVCIALRSDTDALDMTEENRELPHRSKVEDKAHMCGHDGHIAMLLGAATLFAEHRARIPSNCTIRLLFQPAEEGPGGAEPMVKEGCLEGVDEVYGIHNFPFIDLGEVRVCEGPIMAHITDWTVDVEGHGGHGSLPHVCLDPIGPACNIVDGFRSIIGTNVPSKESAVLVVTGIHSGTAQNVIPDKCQIFGSIRDFSPAVCATIRQRMTDIVKGAALAAGGDLKFNIDFSDSYPVLVNDREAAAIVHEVAKNVVGEKNVSADGLPILASEDFSYFTEAKKGCFFFLGGAQEGRTNTSCHSTSYDFNDHCIPIGIELWVRLAEHRFSASILK